MSFERTVLGLAVVLALGACSSGAQVATTTGLSTVELPTTTSEEPATTTSLAKVTTSTVVTSTSTAVEATSTTAIPPGTNPAPPTTAEGTPPDDNRAPIVTITSPAHLSSHVAELNESENRFGAAIQLSADVIDPDGDPVSVEWYSSEEGFLGSGIALTAVIHTGQFDSAQPHITAVGTDPWGAASEDSVQIVIWVPSDT